MDETEKFFERHELPNFIEEKKKKKNLNSHLPIKLNV